MRRPVRLVRCVSHNRSDAFGPLQRTVASRTMPARDG